MKHIYFIRHGETLKNLGYVHQGPEEPLTERGRKQVQQVIAYLQDQRIDTLVSSNYLRARQTAEMIGEVIGLPCAIEPSVREFGRPLSLYGHNHYSFASFRYLLTLYRHRLDLLWDNDGAENLANIRERVQDARLMLESLPGERIAVVSHRIFMSMFTETVCSDKPLSLLRFLLAIVNRRRIPNTGILHFTCDHVRNWTLVETVLPPYNR